MNTITDDKKAVNTVSDADEAAMEEAVETDESSVNVDETTETQEIGHAQDEVQSEQGQSPGVERILQLENELAEMKNRYLRAQADLDNFRRRTRKEKEEQAKYAAMPVLKALLPVLDNLERALAASRDGNSSDGLIQGVEMVNKQIFDVLEQEGLEAVPSVGEPFNPEFHEAVMQVESDEYEPGVVVEELQKGYRLKDRLIRPSMVKVSQ